MSVEKDAKEYKMDHKRRGKAVIFNHDDKSNPCPGSVVDVSALTETYEELGFEVVVHQNLNLTDIRNAITKLAEENHSDADCLLVTVLTQGAKNGNLALYEQCYHPNALCLPFTADKCKDLAGKPKIFIIQACRGTNLDPAVTPKQGTEGLMETDVTTEAYRIPILADFLIVYNSVEGYYSVCDPEKGTWYIQCLCKELQEHPSTKDFLKILTQTSRRVAIGYDPSKHQKKQVPSFTSMLIRDIYFQECRMEETRTKTSSSEAVMSTAKYEEEYKMDHKRRGKAVIFNHDKFKREPDRPGSAADVSALEKTYNELGFEVVVHPNFNLTDIRNAITKLAEENHYDADCLLVTVLTHGAKNGYLASFECFYHIEELWEPFIADKCPSLAGKPKIFIIQACRGKNLDPGVTMKQGEEGCTEPDMITEAHKIPTEADFLIAYSTVEGYYSWRNTEKGTWFIQSLCKEMQKHASTKDFLKILTGTSCHVAVDYESNNKRERLKHQKKQVPSFTSMLICDLYFRSKISKIE